MGRIPQNTYIYKDLLHKETSFQLRNKGRFYTTIKTQKLSESKVCIIYLSSSTLEWKKFSNLTFGRQLAGTTPVPFVTFSSSSLLCRSCLEHVRTVQLTDDFQHHQSKRKRRSKSQVPSKPFKKTFLTNIHLDLIVLNNFNQTR